MNNLSADEEDNSFQVKKSEQKANPDKPLSKINERKLRERENSESSVLDKDMELPAEAINDMSKLLLKNVKIIIAEWIPSGPNFISVISEEMGGIQGREWMFVTHKDDLNPFASCIDESLLERETLSIEKTDFFQKQTSGKSTQTKSLMSGKAQIRVTRCHPTDYLEFEARIFYEDTVEQKENVNIYVDRNGLFAYSADLKKVKIGEIVAREWIPVFMLTRVIPDLIEDTTPLSEGLLGTYQKDMLNSVFEGFRARNKYILIIADEINPVKVPEERKDLCRKDVFELLKEESSRKAILELVDMIPDQGILEIGGPGSGRFMINGTRASILIDPDFSLYKSVLKLPLICKALGSFLKVSYAKIWVLWKELTKIGQDSLSEIKKRGRINVTKAIKTQELLAERNSRVTLINDVINYVLLSCDVLEKQIEQLTKDLERLPEEDIRPKIVNELSFATTIDVLKSRANVQNNLTKNLLDEANGTSGLLSTMVNNELIRQSRMATNIALALAIGSIFMSLYSVNLIPANFLITISAAVLIIIALIVIIVAGKRTLKLIQSKRKSPIENEFKPVI
jgi:hypothetical protein